MAKKKAAAARRRAILQYPAHWFDPEDLLSFIELRPFQRRWQQVGLGDKDLQALQVLIMLHPRGGAVIEGTGGLRKLRFSPPQWGKGKSGALRVCYSYVQEVGVVILALVYAKGEKDDLTKAERDIIRKAVGRVVEALLSRPYRCTPRR